MSVRPEADIVLLQGDLEAARRDLSEVQEQIATATDTAEQGRLQRTERAILDKIETISRAIGAAEARAEEKNREEAEANATQWKNELYSQALVELSQAEATVMALLRELRAAFDQWKACAEAWERKRRDLGNPIPALRRAPPTLFDWLDCNPLHPGTKERRSLLHR